MAEAGLHHEDDNSDEEVLDTSSVDRLQFVIKRNLKKRIDVYLQSRLKGISRSKVRQLIDQGNVIVNSRQAKASTVIRAGDAVEVNLPSLAVRTIDPEPIPLHILYEDQHCIVVNKQADLIVHPARGNLRGTLINGLAHHFKQQIEAQGGEWTDWKTRGFSPGDVAKREGQNRRRSLREQLREQALSDDEPQLDLTDDDDEEAGRVPGLSAVGAKEYRPGIVHRLDRYTTGVMVVAKSDEAHWQIARQFETRKTLKSYLAIVHGCPDPPDAPGGVIDLPIGKHPTIHEAMCVRHDRLGKPSVTIFRVRERYQGYSLVELELKTGRTHQIRVHLSHMGCPIVGDILYGGEPVGLREIADPPVVAARLRGMNYARDKAEGQRMETQAAERGDILIQYPALHATLLRFTHPILSREMTFTAPLHEPMRTVVDELRQHPTEGRVATEGYWCDLNLAIPPRE